MPAYAEHDHRDALRALIDIDFADRFARILRETPAEQRAAALARLRELKAASLASLSQVTMVRPSGPPRSDLALRSLSVRHRAERKTLAQVMAARRAMLVLGFQNAQDDITDPINRCIRWRRSAIKSDHLLP